MWAKHAECISTWRQILFPVSVSGAATRFCAVFELCYPHSTWERRLLNPAISSFTSLQSVFSTVPGSQGYRDTGIQGYRNTRIQGYMITRIEKYRDAGIKGNRDTGIQGYRDTWTEGNKDTRIQGYRDKNGKRDTGIQGYRDTEGYWKPRYTHKGIQGYMNTSKQGYRDT